MLSTISFMYKCFTNGNILKRNCDYQKISEPYYYLIYLKYCLVHTVNLNTSAEHSIWIIFTQCYWELHGKCTKFEYNLFVCLFTFSIYSFIYLFWFPLNYFSFKFISMDFFWIIIHSLKLFLKPSFNVAQ